MSQHPDSEAAEKFARKAFYQVYEDDGLDYEPHWPVAALSRDGFLTGANHVRASLAPELREVREIMEEVRAMGHWGARPCANDKNCVSCSQSSYANEALEILSRLMGKGEV